MKEYVRKLNQSPWLPTVLIAAWTLINLLQAGFTELFHDEAYYWMFSQHLSWGYAEHAPLIAALIRLSSSILPGEIGVRFFPVLLHTAAIYLMTRIVQPKHVLLWFAILFSVFEIHVGGFFAAPDSPLIFFTALFFFLYQKFVRDQSWTHTLLLAYAVIGMLYSKYHGIMILGCTLLSNISLLKNKKFWTIVILAGLAWSPVLYWLIEQRFETFTFHLFNRVRRPNDGSFTLNYIVSQFLIMGPLVGFLVLPAAFLSPIQDQFQRTLKFCVIGVLSFLLLVSLNTWVEANWSASAMIAALILAYPLILSRPTWKKWLSYLSPISIIILMLLRLNLVADLIPFISSIRNETHGWENWATEIEDIAKPNTVLFYNSYQYPSKFTFYSGKPSHSLNNFLYHKNQYDNWDFEESLHGQDVLFVSSYRLPGMDTLHTSVGKDFYYREIKNLHTFNRIAIENLSDQREFEQGKTYTLPLKLVNGYEEAVEFGKNPDMPPQLTCNLFKDGVWVKQYRPLPPMTSGVLIDTLLVDFPLTIDLSEGDYDMLFSIRIGWLDGSINGTFQEISIR